MPPPSAHQEILKQLFSPTTHPLFSLPVSPRKPILASSSRISELSLHPVLESLLHILNLDLPSAHFLLRHMQAAPAYEAMYLHGILHRIEGDLDNARAWYGDVQDSDVFRAVWSEMGGGFDGEDEDKDDDEGRDCDLGRSPVTRPESRTESAQDEKEHGHGHSSLTNHGGPSPRIEPIQRALSFLDQLAQARTTVRSGQTAPANLVHTSLDELSRVWRFCEAKFGTHQVLDASNVWVSMAEKHADIAEKMIVGGEGWREF